MSNARVSEPLTNYSDDARPVLLVNDFIESLLLWGTAVVLFGVLFLNQTHIETNDHIKLAGKLELLSRLAVTGAAGLLGIYGFVFVPKVRLAFLSFPGVWVLGILICSLTGTMFSPMRSYALPYLITVTAIVLFSPFSIHMLGTKRFFDIVLLTMILTVVGSWYLYLFMPQYGVAIEFISKTESVARMGGTSHPNSLAGVAVLMIMLVGYLGFEGKRSWYFCLPLIGLGLATLAFTGTRVAVVAGVFSMLFVYRKFWLRGDVLPYTFAIGAIVLFAALIRFSSDGQDSFVRTLAGSATRSGNMDEITSVTGRSHIWAFVIEKVQERPLWGYGPGTAKVYLGERGLFHAHNVVLGLAFSGGVFAGCFAVMMFLHQLIVSLGGKYRLAALISLVILLNSLTEMPIFDYIPGTPTVLWLVALFWPIFDDGSL
ncbi:O-antigen ligase family protein [Mariniblastus sp.]|nr:O-antigen ligase family protein [Mariniblastus sp.]